MTCSESTDNAVSFSNQEGVTALVTSTGTESLSDQRAAHRPGVSSERRERTSRPDAEYVQLHELVGSYLGCSHLGLSRTSDGLRISGAKCSMSQLEP